MIIYDEFQYKVFLIRVGEQKFTAHISCLKVKNVFARFCNDEMLFFTFC